MIEIGKKRILEHVAKVLLTVDSLHLVCGV